MAERATAYWSTAPGRGELRDEDLPAPGPGEVLVRSLYSGISRGTEALVAQGVVPHSEWQRMRSPFQAGEFPFPVKYGYCSVGEVVAGDPVLCGSVAFCLHPHQSAYVVPVAAVTILPEGLPPARAVLAANMETALNIVWDGAVMPGERVVVIGAGVVGSLVAHLCARVPGVEATLVDLRPEREALAATFGVGFALPGDAPTGADLVVHASGQAQGLVTALACAGTEARVVEASWFGDRAVALPLGEAFHSRRLTLRSSQVGMVAARMRPRWDHGRRLRKALDLLRDPLLDALIDGEHAFADLPALMADLVTASGTALCRRIVYPGARPEARP